jgi:hypothetical protein
VAVSRTNLCFPPVRPEQFIVESSVLAQELTRALGLRGEFAMAVGGAGSPALPQRGRGWLKTTQQRQQQTEADEQPDAPAIGKVVREPNGMGVASFQSSCHR